METNKKTIGNAMSAYFLIFVCAAFFLNKENKLLNNDFVKSHTKTALMLHVLFLFVYIVFISLRLGASIHLLSFSLNIILASTSFIVLFGVLMYGIYHASKGLIFTIGDVITLSKTRNFVHTSEKKEISEQDKFAIIASHIPFLGFFTYGRYLSHPQIHSIVKLNLIVSCIIAFFYVVGGNNMANFLTLVYIVYVVFVSMTLVAKEEIISLNLEKLPAPSEKYIWMKTLISYTFGHIREKEFTTLRDLYNKKQADYKAAEALRHTEQEAKKDIPLPHVLIYVPIINLIFLGFLGSKYRYHIINGFIITLMLVGLLIAFGITSIVPLLVVFPISFGLGYMKRLGYKMPVVYDAYAIVAGIGNTIKSLFSKGRKIQKTEQTVSMKVGEEKTINSAPEKTQ